MFAATGCELLPEGGGGVAEVKRSDHQVALHGGAGGEKMSLLRRWEFDHTRMTMSVAVFVPLPGQAADLEGHHGGVVPSLQRGEEIGSVEVFCKGSFEAVTSACVPESVPKEAEESFRYFALRGCYVLAMASRSVCTDVKRKEGLSAVKGMSREGVEKGLWWRGLLLFRNELKSDTAKAIREVRAAGIRPVMVTGDTAFCGAFVASASSLWGPLSPSLSVPVNDGTLTVKGGEEREGGEGGQGEGTGERNWEQLLADVEENKEGGGECVVWRSLRSASIAPWSTEEVEESMRSRAASAASAMKGVRGGRRVDALIEIQDLELAVTGRAFDVLKIEGRLGVRSPLLFGLRLFARMSPSQKIEVVEMYRREGLMVGMCGDGGNDCGALRKAHCGVALSEAEASAVAPFTARHKRVGDVVTLLKEGRCALQTSLACYKLIVLYGLLFSVLKIWGFSSGAVMCQMSYVMIDVVAVLGLSYTMSLVGPKTELAKDNRPTSSLLGGMTTSSLVGMWVIDICFLAGAFAAIQQSANYQRFPAEYSDGWAWWTLSDSWEASTLFTVIFAQFVSGAMVFSLGDEFRQAVWRSWPVFSLSLALFGFTLFLILSPSNPLTRLFHTASENFNAPGTDSPAWKAYQEAGHPAADTSMPMEMRGVLAALVIANALALMLWQKIGVEGAFGTAIKTRFPTKRLLIGS
uniref:Cation-transporting P-type ATPase C-terminal domain-containing protein n=1 Tax=Chromera velia CCMP2878 TaxID=1169474 RepID=A0A0G4GDT0_9ALVE|eukprot:Cvel_4563.t1-p1 / transcript=Cvel_4563.t1 / gene=Cvel_4563 / organism=Chromera_velia_CCMP2878 / gene_product=Probable cation-transporting ATPase 13A4, putative / transcript_product=Probable cation-transporting ATPase 13A4, putative / location=Cvel_scaffold200:56589-58661(+) / protein_length=691 / sequence_SO=supercontig / SO=protein_coding / is_pseudo=false